MGKHSAPPPPERKRVVMDEKSGFGHVTKLDKQHADRLDREDGKK